MRGKLPVAVAVAGVLGLLLGSLWLRAQKPEIRSLPALMPPGALFYLEAKDFHRLVDEWNSATEKSLWLKSANYSTLAQSRLLQRLAQAQTEFASVAGVSVEMNLVNQIAGSQSGFAFYDFSNLQFVYVTRLEENRIDVSDLWKLRGGYQSRQVAGISFYTKTGTSGNATHTVAFAESQGWFIMATDPDKMARCLTLLAGQSAASLADESWFKDATKAAAEQGDLRLVANLDALEKTPHFRTYWIQGNQTELKAYSAGTSDLFDSANGFEERRTLLRRTGAGSTPPSEGLAEALSYVVPDASLYRAWANPDRETLRSVLQQVVLSNAPLHTSLNRTAPEVSIEAAITGSSSDLETRIDEPELKRTAQANIDDVVNVIISMQPVAILHNQATKIQPDHVFLIPQSEAVVVCNRPDLASLEKSLATSVSLAKVGGLDPLRVSFSGHSILLSRFAPHQPGKTAALLPGEIYAAGYNHAEGWPRYRSIFGLIDRGATNPETPVSANTPEFFSSNVQSLGDSLPRLRSASIVTQNSGEIVRDTVRYELAAK